MEPAKFSESEWIEAKDIHLYYFPESDLAFLIILLVNQDLTIDNFYEFINPGYMLDYGTVEKLRANFLTEIECKNCWAFLLCSSCGVSCTGSDGFCAKKRLKKCGGIQQYVIKILRSIKILEENGYDFYRFEKNVEE